MKPEISYTSKADKELLLSYVLGKSRTYVIAHPEIKLTKNQQRKYHILLKRLKQGEPLAYLLKSQPFYGLDFFVDKHVLIPRPETEWLVERTLDILKRNKKIKTVIDIGTGSGCIIISLAKNISRPDIKFLATDISKKALSVAKKNAKLHNVNINFLHGDLLKPMLRAYGLQLIAPVLIVANLPYLTADDYKNASVGVRKFEPKKALYAGQDGLKYYGEFIKQLKKFGLNKLYCVWEIDPCHSQKLKMLIKKTFPKAKIKIEKDFNEMERYLVGIIN